jgi:P-loop containing NTP hydrolase pore-1
MYAMQRFQGPRLHNGDRAGFLLGDGAGVGKGRQIAALIKEMWARGSRRILWLSHCKDLREDARRDMVDCNITVPSSKREPSDPHEGFVIDVWPGGNKAVPPVRGEVPFGDGVFFVTYQLLIAGTSGIGKWLGKKQRCVRRQSVQLLLAAFTRCTEPAVCTSAMRSHAGCNDAGQLADWQSVADALNATATDCALWSMRGP